jgi:hypothetical protein
VRELGEFADKAFDKERLDNEVATLNAQIPKTNVLDDTAQGGRDWQAPAERPRPVSDFTTF